MGVEPINEVSLAMTANSLQDLHEEVLAIDIDNRPCIITLLMGYLAGRQMFLSGDRDSSLN